MTTIMLWRHAKTQPGSPEFSDRERELLPVGHTDAESVAHRLLEEGLIPDRVLSSDAARARQTTVAVAWLLPAGVERMELLELYHADAAELPDIIAVYAGGARRVLVVGHNPAVAEFVSRAAGTETRMRPGYLAVIEAEASHAGDLDRASGYTLKRIIVPPRYS